MADGLKIESGNKEIAGVAAGDPVTPTPASAQAPVSVASRPSQPLPLERPDQTRLAYATRLQGSSQVPMISRVEFNFGFINESGQPIFIDKADLPFNPEELNLNERLGVKEGTPATKELEQAINDKVEKLKADLADKITNVYVSASASPDGVVVKFLLSPVPKAVHPVITAIGEPLPPEDEEAVRGMIGKFFQPPHTSQALQDGRYRTIAFFNIPQKYFIKNCDFAYTAKGEIDFKVLLERSSPLTLSQDISVKYIKRTGGDNGEIMDMDPASNVMKEFEQIKAGEIFDMAALQRAMARITSRYPMDVQFPHDVEFVIDREKNTVAVTVNVYDIGPAVAVNVGFGLNSVEDEIVGKSGSLGARLKLENGWQPGFRASYFSVGEDAVLGGGLSLTVPWATDGGTTLTMGASGSYVLDGNAYNHMVAESIGVDVPLGGAHSSVGGLLKLGVQSLIDPENGYENSWLKPDVGVRYQELGTSARLTTGPRFSDDGGFYWEAGLKAGQKVSLVDRLHLDIQGVAGTKLGELPDSQLFRGLEYSTGYEGVTSVGGKHHAGLRLDLVQPITVDRIPVVNLRAGVSGRVIDTPLGLVSQAGVGAGVDIPILGAQILAGPRVTHIQDETVVDPFAVTFGVSKEF